MTHPALEARARGALKPLAHEGDIPVPFKFPADLLMKIFMAAERAETSPNALIVDVLCDAFPSEAPR